MKRAAGVAIACGGGLSATFVWGFSPAVATAFAVGVLTGTIATTLTSAPRSMRSYERRKTKRADAPRPSTLNDRSRGEVPAPRALVIDREEARVTLHEGRYHVEIRRWLDNRGHTPITEYSAFISVDRFAGLSRKSAQFYRQNPLTVDELRLSVRLNGRPIRWSTVSDYESSKEIWLLFEDEKDHFPLEPGEQAILEYSYSVGANKWGPFFVRAIRMPTHFFLVQVRLPARLTPNVWGTIKNSTKELEEALDITCTRENDLDVFTWSTEDPRLYALVQMRWQFTHPAASVESHLR